jgi:hypothetical protein
MDGEAWSGVANLTLSRHRRNTFAAGPGPLSAAGYSARFEEANANAVSAAHAAGRLIESVPSEALDAVLGMHTDIHLLADSLSAVRSAWPGPSVPAHKTLEDPLLLPALDQKATGCR